MKTKLDKKKLKQAIKMCATNGRRLLEEAEWHGYGLSPTSLVLSVLAEEEFAKAFILIMVMEGALPWTQEVHRSLSNHECKHLLGLVIDWLYPSWEEVRERFEAFVKRAPADEFTADVANAMNIFRHEQIERMERGFCLPEKEWGGRARKIAKGLLDREKQSALYVCIAGDGGVASNPSVSKARVKSELERAKRFEEFVRDADSGLVAHTTEYRRVSAALKAIFADLATRKGILGETS